jgi:predicted amidohydrolase YtcJ
LFQLRKNGWHLCLASIAFLFTAIGWSQASPSSADTLVVNARIYTVNPHRPWAEAIAVRDGKIVAEGSTSELTSYRKADTKVIDAGQHLTLPGFVDCHIHFMDGSIGLTPVGLNGTKTVAEIRWVWHSIESSGGRLAFGSDWPVVTLNPWPGVRNALTRQTTEADPPGGFVPTERITLEDTIKAYTLGGAFAGRREKTEGSLELGKLADLIVLSQDLFKINPNEISKEEVLLTMVGGKVVYQSANWSAAGGGH